MLFILYFQLNTQVIQLWLDTANPRSKFLSQNWSKVLHNLHISYATLLIRRIPTQFSIIEIQFVVLLIASAVAKFLHS